MSKAAKAKPAPVNEGFQIPRITFAWLMASVIVVLLPHVTHLPLWLIGLCAACLVARVYIYQGRLSAPGNRIKRGAVVLMLVLTVVPRWACC